MVLKPATVGAWLVRITATLLVIAALPATASAQSESEHDYLADVGAKLSNPVSDVWAHFTQFGLTFSDGDARPT